MNDFLQFLKDMHSCTWNLMLVPVVSVMKGISLSTAYDNWYYHFVIKKFL